MSRSIGDEVAKRFGVVALPEIRRVVLSEEDRYIVIGSDGVWEFLSNQAVADMATPHMINKRP